MITLYLNDKKHTISEKLSLYDFLMQNKIEINSIAVTVNNTLVLRKDLKTIFLHANDCVDILMPMQGG